MKSINIKGYGSIEVENQEVLNILNKSPHLKLYLE